MSGQIFTLLLSTIIFTTNPLFAMDVEDTDTEQQQKTRKRRPEPFEVETLAKRQALGEPCIFIQNINILEEVNINESGSISFLPSSSIGDPFANDPQFYYLPALGQTGIIPLEKDTYIVELYMYSPMYGHNNVSGRLTVNTHSRTRINIGYDQSEPYGGNPLRLNIE